MKYRLPVQAGLMLASLLLVCVVHAEELFDAEGYRSSQYRSPTPSTLEGVQILDTPALKKLLDERPDVQLIDVYRQLWRHDRFIEEEPHANIPGSLWLPNTGSGNLETLWLRYFTHYLSQASKGDLNKPLVFYCRPDCWPSWNAARRAMPWAIASSTGTVMASTPGSRPACPWCPRNPPNCLPLSSRPLPHHNHNNEVQGHVQDSDCRRPSAVS